MSPEERLAVAEQRLDDLMQTVRLQTERLDDYRERIDLLHTRLIRVAILVRSIITYLRAVKKKRIV